MKTCLYIDGFNLYRSVLKGTKYKWLDVMKLFKEHILTTQGPQAEIVKLKFFTAPVKASYSKRGPDAVIAQNHYLRALQASYPSKVEIIMGFHLFQHTALPRYIEGVEANKNNMSPVWLIEEKQTDVQIAMHIYRDAMLRDYEQLVVCTNDSDLEPCLKFVKEDRPETKLGLVTPLPHRGYLPSTSNQRLVQYSDWTRRYIREEELAASQLKPVVTTKRKPARKPPHW